MCMFAIFLREMLVHYAKCTFQCVLLALDDNFSHFFAHSSQPFPTCCFSLVILFIRWFVYSFILYLQKHITNRNVRCCFSLILRSD